MKGLIIKPNWAELILNGQKDWELRSNDTKIRGTIGIIESKTGKVFGTVDLIDTILLNKEIFDNNINHHKFTLPFEKLTYKKTWVWVLKNPVRFKEPILYNHKQGCVIWVNLDY